MKLLQNFDTTFLRHTVFVIFRLLLVKIHRFHKNNNFSCRQYMLSEQALIFGKFMQARFPLLFPSLPFFSLPFPPSPRHTLPSLSLASFLLPPSPSFISSFFPPLPLEVGFFESS